MNAQKTLVERQRRQPGEPASDERFRALGQAVLELEADAVRTLTERVDATFVRACRHMLACRGRVVVTGMGKSGHIAGKIAATLASTGTPAFFVHPGEASHGDLGMITRDDVVLALSNSGETNEITTILPLIRRLHVPLIALTGNPDSTLARAADDHLDVSVAQEACPLGLAPTASTTASLAMGDALAIALLEARGFTADDFARSHPGGRLGRRLLLLVEDVMHTGTRIPRVGEDTPLAEALLEITRKGLGMTAIVDGDDRILGVFTDGDLRRCLDQGLDIHRLRVGEVMTRGGRTVRPDALAAEALELMESHRINALLVTDDGQRLLGALNMHDLLRAGVV
ncbi:KpsF/GutQ family sugar-phosphate isomerase [Alkalilimnicola ehrlichii MLHE-1]|uniref:Arabinose 5-phosphate isomerase n=1 Tax=Alkalilimnicola ehrlichii (strain ATCC BAA-1101 / DSM 17681 / MLHE-1) TaxID=187272 RepID=Q0A6H0_ALKEH|nr:KpsF/GutQ family sugar-phosphate isomerase [Alkalilimnicola ehrlichii]ABI57567.1 KpsF/GutQ family protein [Alkalilimnicola ehrlichii MLHE-1]